MRSPLSPPVPVLAFALALVSCVDDGDIRPVPEAENGEGESEGEGESAEGEGEGEGDGEGEPVQTGGSQPTPPPADPLPFDLALRPQEHVCEGDEDICEPAGDLGKPYFDILASWSRVEGDELVVQVLFRGVTFLCWGQLAFIVSPGAESSPAVSACAADPSTCRSGALYVSVETWNEYGDGGLTNRAFVPPVDTQFFYTNHSSADVGYVPGLISFGRGGRLLEMRLPLTVVSSSGTVPPYQLFVNFGGDLMWGDEEGMASSESAGGSINDAEPVTAPMATRIFDGNDYCTDPNPS